jgi:hypothetical protein
VGSYKDFDPTFDFSSDAGSKDPAIASPTLRSYHQGLWTKPLPGGELFNLVFDYTYLAYEASDMTFVLSSDASIPTWTRWKRMQPLISQFSDEESQDFRRIAAQMGGMMLFPRNRVHGQAGINAARGFTTRISDRLDLTLECIRLYYAGTTDPASNPLGPVLARYPEFFALFESFPGYVDFFLLQDLVDETASQVDFFLPSDGFTLPPRARTAEEYAHYRAKSIAFVQARNARMLEQSRRTLADPL